MKLTVQKDVLNNNINLVLKAVSSKSSMPILEYILLKTSDNGFTMQSTDLKLAIKTSNIECNIEENGIVALDAKFFSELVRKLPSGEVSIYVNEDFDVEIKSGKAKFNIKGLQGDDFPIISEVEEVNKLTIKTEDFDNLVKKTVFSVAQDDSKPVLTGELFEVNNNNLRVVAVDGFRISYGEVALNNDNTFSAVIPEKSLKEIRKIISTDKKEEIELIFSDKNVKFVLDSCIVVSRLIDGDFIKFNQLFEVEYKTKITVNRLDLFNAIDRTTLISREIKRSPIKLDINDKSLIVTSNTDTGKYIEDLSVTQEGDNLEIGFNPKFLLDALEAVTSDSVEITFNNNLSPCIVKSTENDDYKYLVLPLRI